MRDTVLPTILSSMTPESREQLAGDVARYGAQMLSEGIGERRAFALWPDLGNRRIKRLCAWAAARRRGQDVHLDVNLPEGDEPVIDEPALTGEYEEDIEALLARREAAFRRKAQKREAANVRLKAIRLPTDDPIALVFVGDQHVDDDGCNLPRLRRDFKVINETPGMLAINLGDITNNWVGNLKRLWGHQSTTLEEEDALLKWVLEAVRWWAIVPGNHDEWNDGVRVIRHILGQNVILAQNQLDVDIIWPSGWVRKVCARHHFTGSSIYNRTHGAKRASLFDGGAAHIYMQGHHHESSFTHEPGRDGIYRVYGKAAGYKWYDSYAASLGFAQHRHGGCLVVICDPHAPESDQMQVFTDVEYAAERLKELRARRAA